jgi:hypothetical protein
MEKFKLAYVKSGGFFIGEKMDEILKKLHKKYNDYGYYQNSEGEWEYYPDKDIHVLLSKKPKWNANRFEHDVAEDDYSEESFP